VSELVQEGDSFFQDPLMAGALLGFVPVAFIYSFFLQLATPLPRAARSPPYPQQPRSSATTTRRKPSAASFSSPNFSLLTQRPSLRASPAGPR
jgi:hypothetical protein